MNLITLDEEKFKIVEVEGYTFKIRYISPLDRINITQKRVRLQGGGSVEALTQEEFEFIENASIVDTCVEKMPKGFKENESCLNWDSHSMINELAQAIRTHSSDVEAKLKKNKPDVGIEEE